MEKEADNVLVADIAQRLHAVQQECVDAARCAGRNADAVRLVAVTKTHSAEVLQAAIAAGVSEIGENYLQEAAEKFHQLGWTSTTHVVAPVIRHAIGHIQTNKARLALQWFDVIETVDSLHLAERLNHLAQSMERKVSVLLQINISKDAGKYGFFAEEVEGVLPKMAKLAHIQVNGLMTIGRYEADPEAARGDFTALRLLQEQLMINCPPSIHLNELSMGMSHDFVVAIEEGATLVRVGSRLFGARN